MAVALATEVVAAAVEDALHAWVRGRKVQNDDLQATTEAEAEASSSASPPCCSEDRSGFEAEAGLGTLRPRERQRPAPHTGLARRDGLPEPYPAQGRQPRPSRPPNPSMRGAARAPAHCVSVAVAASSWAAHKSPGAPAPHRRAAQARRDGDVLDCVTLTLLPRHATSARERLRSVDRLDGYHGCTMQRAPAEPPRLQVLVRLLESGRTQTAFG
eukprot:2306471-Prymnesium_polylepis.1